MNVSLVCGGLDGAGSISVCGSPAWRGSRLRYLGFAEIAISCSGGDVTMVSRQRRMTLVLGIVLLTAGCGAKSINQVLADPAKYRNQTGTVHGTVDESVSVLGLGAHRIADGHQR